MYNNFHYFKKTIWNQTPHLGQYQSVSLTCPMTRRRETGFLLFDIPEDPQASEPLYPIPALHSFSFSRVIWRLNEQFHAPRNICIRPFVNMLMARYVGEVLQTQMVHLVAASTDGCGLAADIDGTGATVATATDGAEVLLPPLGSQ